MAVWAVFARRVCSETDTDVLTLYSTLASHSSAFRRAYVSNWVLVSPWSSVAALYCGLHSTPRPCKTITRNHHNAHKRRTPTNLRVAKSSFARSRWFRHPGDLMASSSPVALRMMQSLPFACGQADVLTTCQGTPPNLDWPSEGGFGSVRAIAVTPTRISDSRSAIAFSSI
ncbi:hypothetical protein PYCCODRAFT_268846 [Trametes coccinea BRFM310]|uniref:Uncharacterized protein n=1 Tax=Trametes coccinea (strain BRFM310) TaxID=1353009 RepID=A0A1Y2IQG5_TRAC3|nr:hypothetical protein PYCCODRAFT_268846 [Trametes coccinea BRFM310]